MSVLKTGKPVPAHLVGQNAPSVRPGDDPAIFGSAVLEGPDPVEVRTFQTFRIVYTVGRLGLDDNGSIRVALRFITDAGVPQTANPAAPNYTTARSNGGGHLEVLIAPVGPRPWMQTVTVRQKAGYLNPGEQIVVTFGDTSKGSPGMLMQTFVEDGYEFKVMADVQATQNFQPLGQQMAVAVIPGPGTLWRAVLPSLRRPGETFRLGLKVEDKWGNPSDMAKGRVRFETSLPVEGLPDAVDYVPADRSMIIDSLSVSQQGTLRIKVLVDGVLTAEAGPLVIRDGAGASYWGDLHGQTGETIGTNSIESYFDFARNKAFLDVTAHQANDFQINTAFWAKINELSEALNEPGVFTVFPGYEWSGNTAVGGDHNVFYGGAGRPIYRCSHALLEDRSDLDSDANTLTDLYGRLRDEDAVVYAHVGGRYANIHYDHDPLIETAVEMHSAWGTFEWILTDGFALRRRVGVVCNSDGHKGRPGASYPGASRFGAYGGLTCFLTDSNDRASIMEAQRRRHHYGTTGCRMHLDVTCGFTSDATIYARNPDAMPDCETWAAREAIMGDIVRVNDEEVSVSIDVSAHAGILSVELRDGEQILETLRPYDESDLGNRLRIRWAGAQYRGRGRDVVWQGLASFDKATIQRIDAVNAWNPETVMEQRGSRSVIWRGATTGNFMACDAWLDEDRAGRLEVSTNHAKVSLSLSDIGLEPQVTEASGLGKQISVQRLPSGPLKRELSIRKTVKVRERGDTPIWVCVTTEDGFQAWSSPIYLFRD